MRNVRKEEGFTLIEVIVAVVIIGLLSAVAFATWNLLLNRSVEDAMALELRSVWDDMRTTALQNGTDPQAHAAEAVDRRRNESDLTYQFSDAPAAVIAFADDRDDNACVALMIVNDASVDRPPIGTCESLALTSMSRIQVAAWWPFDDAAGSTSASTDGEDSFSVPTTGVTFWQEPAGPHARFSDDDHSARADGGRAVFADDDGLTDPVSGLTFGMLTNGSTGTPFQVGESADVVLGAGFTASVEPTCTSGDATATSNEPIVVGEWFLFACQLYPNGDVAVNINGVERGRAARSDEAPPAWVSGQNVYLIGSDASTYTGGIDHTFIERSTMSAPMLRAVWNAMSAPLFELAP